MKYDKYVVSFIPGSSGRFIVSILDRMIRQSEHPIELCENNSAHLNQTYTGISHSNPNDPEIFKYLEFDSNERVESSILSTHTFPNFNLINQRLSNIGIILITVAETDIIEVIFNSHMKNRNRKLSYNELMLHKQFALKKHSKFITVDTYPDNCLLLEYSDLFEREDDEFLALKKIKEFTNLAVPQHVIETYKNYVNNRTEILKKYPWIKPDQDKYK